MKRFENIQYAPWIDKRLTLDLFVPEIVEPDLCVILVHGGGWDKGDKEMMKAEMELLAQWGYAAAAINYRLSDCAIFPAQWHDLLFAIEHLRKDFSRIVLFGHSAGGHLAALAGLADPHTRAPIDETKVNGVIAVSGMFDFTFPTMSVLGFPVRGYIERLLGGSYDELATHTAAAQASPIAYAGSIDTRGMPRFLLLCGERDDLPREQSNAFYTALRNQGANVDYRIIAGGGHYIHIEQRAEVMQHIQAFLGGLPDNKRKG